MKNGKILLYFSIIFLMFFGITNVNAADNVKIKSIELMDKSTTAVETNDATFDGLTMNFDLKFYKVNDYAKYKIVVENKENKDYDISVDSEFNNSKYITYEYEKTDNIKSNSESEFYVTVTYKNKVDESNFIDDKYTEKNSAILKLSNDNISNPKTFNNEVMIIIVLIIMSGILFTLFRNNKTRKISAFVLMGMLSTPLFVKAVDYLKITVNSNVVIEKGYSVDYELNGYIKASEFDEFDLSHAELYDTVYVGDVSDENKYVWCTSAIYKGKKLYASGEKVKHDTSSVKSYYFDEDKDCQFIGNDDDGNNILTCGTPEQIYIFKNVYDIKDIERFGYKYNEDDDVIMKFSNAKDNWRDFGYFIINEGSTFTMPNHDVLFSIYEI